MKPTKFLCIIGDQRSGSTAFRSFLRDSGKFRDCGEVFQNVEHVVSFPKYCEDRNFTASDLLDAKKNADLLDGFLDFIEESSGDSYPLIDVKFNALFASQSTWGYPTDLPIFLNKLNFRGAHFVFLFRKDLFAQVVSFFIASNIGKWHNIKVGDLAEKINLNVNQCMQKARSIMESERICRIWYDKLGSCEQLFYEDLFDDEGVVVDNVKYISDKFRVSFINSASKIQKNLISKREFIENIKELEAAFEDLQSEFSASSISNAWSARWN